MMRAMLGMAEQSPRRLVHRQTAETVTEERERRVEQMPHLRDQLFDELADVGNRPLVDPAQAARRLDGDDLDVRIERLPPAAIHGGAAAGERKAEQAKPRR